MPTINRGLTSKVLFLKLDIIRQILFKEEDNMYMYVPNIERIIMIGIAKNKNGLSIPNIIKAHKVKLAIYQGISTILRIIINFVLSLLFLRKILTIDKIIDTMASKDAKTANDTPVISKALYPSFKVSSLFSILKAGI